MKRRSAIIITASVIAVAVAGIAFCIVQNYQRNKAYERMYGQLISQGYDDTGQYTPSSGEDSLSVAPYKADGKERTELPTEETFQKAEMAQKMLEELHYPIISKDTLDKVVIIDFMYEDEHMSIVAENNKPGIVVEDMPWKQLPLDDAETLYAMMVAINRANYNHPFKILYFEDEDTVRVLTRQQLLMNEFTPHKAKLLESSVRNMIRVHEYFQDTMVRLVQVMMEEE